MEGQPGNNLFSFSVANLFQIFSVVCPNEQDIGCDIKPQLSGKLALRSRTRLLVWYEGQDHEPSTHRQELFWARVSDNGGLPIGVPKVHRYHNQIVTVAEKAFTTLKCNTSSPYSLLNFLKMV